jgi:hypothetical protein
MNMHLPEFILVFQKDRRMLWTKLMVYKAEYQDGQITKAGHLVSHHGKLFNMAMDAFGTLGERISCLQPGNILLSFRNFYGVGIHYFEDYIKKNEYAFLNNSKQEEIFTNMLIKEFVKLSDEVKESAAKMFCLVGDERINQNSEEVVFHQNNTSFRLEIYPQDELIIVDAFIVSGENKMPLSGFTSLGMPVMEQNQELFILPNYQCCAIAKEIFSEENFRLEYPLEDFVKIKKEVADKMKSFCEVDIHEYFLPREVEVSSFEKKIYVSELNDTFLMIRPVFVYDGKEVDANRTAVIEKEIDGKAVIIKRYSEEENAFFASLVASNPLFESQANKEFLFLKFDDAMKKNWLFSFFVMMRDQYVPIIGFDMLRKLNYNPNPPVLNISGNKAADWFDLNIEIAYGEQIVKLKDLRKAVIRNQQYILLEDGTMGIIPEEWIQKLMLVMKMGKESEGHLHLSKFNYTILDDLYESIGEGDIREELNRRKQQLSQIENTVRLPLPAGLTASMRPYQEEGYHWLNQLHQIGWGGCLADDMGLGKTLQTISFLLKRIEENPELQHLIVCPTSLMYNWESEIQKFANTITYAIHHGSERNTDITSYQDKNLIITSYGTLRNDIEIFGTVTFGYAVLDESHMIKNPESKVFKAMQLIKANNRIALSGTPLQNNTTDLYAQMHFLNPGILGSREFFTNEFSVPIDRGDKVKAESLRKMIYPFLLRRSKEAVAKDLPEKTETVIYCTLEKEQRVIYNWFKDKYRKIIMSKIDEVGIAKSGITIIEGMMKLRQICDSPALLNEDKKYSNHSVKLNELMRELEDNISTRKVLIFSQFLKMLELIGEALKERNIDYNYLDGSLSPEARKREVDQFQNSDKQRVFLISLKAGGIGLNLTEADYVYLVDPWWNPAVEAQAIDRTHRIGQKKNVFAYRLICKNTIEEKIMSLQQKKKNLSEDLIAEESGFIKHLTKEDVEFLFE